MRKSLSILIIFLVVFAGFTTIQASGGDKKPDQQAKELMDKYGTLEGKAQLGPEGSKIIDQLKVLPGLSRASQDAVARLQAHHSLRQIAIAVHEFHELQKKIKQGDPKSNWFEQLLPYLEQKAVPAMAPPPIKWEYKIAVEEDIRKLGKGDATAGLNMLGNDNWEVVSIRNTTFFFKRPNPKQRVQMPFDPDEPEPDLFKTERDPKVDQPNVKDLDNKLSLPPGEELPGINKVKKSALIKLQREEEAEIDAMKTRALAWFKANQLANGTWKNPSGDAFAGVGGLALLECGIPAADAAVQKAAKNVRLDLRKQTSTYPIAFGLVFLCQLADPKDAPMIKNLTMRLMAAQSSSGGWGYVCPFLGYKEEQELTALLNDMGASSWEEYSQTNFDKVSKMSPILKRMAIFQPREPRPPEFFDGQGDNNHAQIALLALWAARREPHKMPVDRSLRLIERKFRETQKADGHWCYANGGGDQTGSMTCAGLLALAVGHALDSRMNPARKRTSPREDEQIKKGMKVVGNAIRSEDPQSRIPVYSLWCMQRIGVLYQLDKIDGDADWYRRGVRILKEKQQADGSWATGSSPAIETAFALLFLEQANFVQDLTDDLKKMQGR